MGTGNDLSRVLGWGATCDDDQKLAAILHEMEHSGVRLLDRWAIQHTPDIAGQLKGHKVRPIYIQNIIHIWIFLYFFGYFLGYFCKSKWILDIFIT